MSSCVLDVPSSVTVRSVAEFGQQLATAIEGRSDVALNVDALQELDLSFVQIVLSARTHVEREGGVLRLARPANPAVAALLRRAGFLAAPDPADIEFWFHGELPQ
ncbi:STAS domain-containing protein [Sphingomonas quercus]|uniref:STAS domain-containing protein n=1 Tax=Sphingomonas quercus TaxID=2842451 RepID=A0ABS6BIB2_9SPHN|nr:STAS domain-containing protein [Sphingomonas quercus]MBU3078048.1 STAS domain-containing protein [Sphingomonas quercus]